MKKWGGGGDILAMAGQSALVVLICQWLNVKKKNL